MPEPETQVFDTGPGMVSPALGVTLAVACIVLAATQAWIAVQHYRGAHQLPAQEPVARLLFGIVFLVAGCGIAVAVLEDRNARIELTPSTITIRNWHGSESEIPWRMVHAVVLLESSKDSSSLPFHWICASMTDGTRVRLSGGPWEESREVKIVRHEIVDRLGFEEHPPQQSRWTLIFPTERTEWS